MDGQNHAMIDKTPHGFSHDYVVIPVRLYESLLSSGGDRPAKAAAETGFVIPSAIIDDMRAGDTAVLAWRRHRNLRQKELAAAAALTSAAICLLEQPRPDGAHRTPKLPSLLALARALGIPDEYRWILKPASRAKLLD